MFFIAYTFKEQAHVFAGQVKIVSHSSCRTSAILKYLSPEMGKKIFTILLKNLFFLIWTYVVHCRSLSFKSKTKIFEQGHISYIAETH